MAPSWTFDQGNSAGCHSRSLIVPIAASCSRFDLTAGCSSQGAVWSGALAKWTKDALCDSSSGLAPRLNGCILLAAVERKGEARVDSQSRNKVTLGKAYQSWRIDQTYTYATTQDDGRTSTTPSESLPAPGPPARKGGLSWTYGFNSWNQGWQP